MRSPSAGGGVAGKVFRFSSVAMNSRCQSKTRERRMRRASRFINFKYQFSTLKEEERRR
jgi:hypothetical protein